jgi:hypothetical protein
LNVRAMALGEQVTPTEFRSFHCPRAIERSLLTEWGQSHSLAAGGVGFPEFSHSLRSGDNPTHWPRAGWDSRSFRTVSAVGGSFKSCLHRSASGLSFFASFSHLAPRGRDNNNKERGHSL